MSPIAVQQDTSYSTSSRDDKLDLAVVRLVERVAGSKELPREAIQQSAAFAAEEHGNTSGEQICRRVYSQLIHPRRLYPVPENDAFKWLKEKFEPADK